MPKSKKRSWKDKQRERQIKNQMSEEGYRIRREIEASRKPKQWPKGKIFFGVCLLMIIISIGAWQSSQPSQTISSGTTAPTQKSPTTTPTTSPSTSTSLAPNFVLKDINGTQFSLSQHKGMVVAIHFMALDCSGTIYPINEYHLQQLKNVCSNYCGKKPVSIVTVAVATCEGCDTILTQIREDYGVTWVMGNDYADGKMDIVDAYASHSITDGTVVLVDQKLNVAEVYTDSVTADALSSKINQLLGA